MVGVLAFHGDFAEHIAVLRLLNVDVQDVRSVDDMRDITHLVIPGGESTVISRFLGETGVGDLIKARVTKGDMAVYGTCAGAILLAKKVTGKHPPATLQLMEITIDRNAYGTQVDSFAADICVAGLQSPVSASFIRAPIITAAGEKCTVLAKHGDYPILVRQGRMLAGTFHPETRGEVAIHKLFLTL